MEDSESQSAKSYDQSKNLQPEAKVLKEEGGKSFGSSTKAKKGSSKNSKKRKFQSQEPGIDEYSVAGLKYKLPGKRQRIIVASVVIALNILLLVAALLYFYNPAFHQFIYSVGRG